MNETKPTPEETVRNYWFNEAQKHLLSETKMAGVYAQLAVVEELRITREQDTAALVAEKLEPLHKAADELRDQAQRAVDALDAANQRLRSHQERVQQARELCQHLPTTILGDPAGNVKRLEKRLAKILEVLGG